MIAWIFYKKINIDDHKLKVQVNRRFLGNGVDDSMYFPVANEKTVKYDLIYSAYTRYAELNFSEWPRWIAHHFLSLSLSLSFSLFRLFYSTVFAENWREETRL